MIYLTEAKDLSAGLWWARQITGDRDLGRGQWAIVEVAGKFPFLHARIVLYCYASQEWGVPNKELRAIDNPNSWEFGARVNVPGDKDRAEYPPRQAKESAWVFCWGKLGDG